MRTWIVIAWLGVLMTAIGVLFWQNEWVYNLPTPVPNNYQSISMGQRVGLQGTVSTAGKKPRFIHFFNPSCPCSRFNIRHFKSLVTEYGGHVNFEMVVLSNKEYTVAEIQDKYDIRIPVSFDTTIASSCGVYSTPQAVIIDTTQKLFYRGNYNRSRYCSDRKTEFARIALDSLLHNNLSVAFDPYALKAYGCQLPKCTK